uniref:Zinc transporter ZIP9 n=1 Tax=Setaria digitata TaxID=48799 RepID=A0A915Q785_9BILA
MQKRTRLLSTFGAGLLVGTALSVIIPEGVESLYLVHNEKYSPKVVRNEQNIVAKQDDVSVSSKKSPLSNPGCEFVERKDQGVAIDFNAINHSIGYSLVVGFIFMLIVDQISRSLSSRGGDRSQYKVTATIGMVVHAAADGVALGSASATDRTGVQFVVFFAILLHKAPAAFGLVSFLLAEGIERFRIRRHLTVFSIAAPVAAVVTYYLIIVVENDKFSADSATGKLLLFSAGTFLYVATVHILPELMGSSANNYQVVDSGSEGSGRGYNESKASLKLIELISVVVGAISPTFLVSGHSHH